MLKGSFTFVEWSSAWSATFAYLDPNSGGLLFQFLLPVFLAISGAWMVFRKRALGLWQRWFGRKNRRSDDKP
jgi:hypothetical protein